MARKAYPSDVSDEEWALVAPYLTLMTEDAPQREHSLRWIVRAGAAWRMMPHDLPPWPTVYQQSQRWLTAGVFHAIVQDLRAVLRLAQGHKAEPSAAIFDSRTCNRRPKVARGRAMTAPSAGGAPRCIWPSTRWAICWPAMSQRPTSKTGARSRREPPKCKR
jgi:transposase